MLPHLLQNGSHSPLRHEAIPIGPDGMGQARTINDCRQTWLTREVNNS